MTPEQWQKVKAVLERALEVEPSQVSACLDEACKDEPGIRAEVESLLESYRQAEDDDPLEAPPLGNNISLLSHAMEDAELGRDIGPYHIIEKIGQGGMGAVYRASTRRNDCAGDVAVKLVRRGMDTEFILKRFESERQILARLEHPNVARLYDGGETDDGRPYFVMEFVEGGKALDTYCDENKLPTVDRLELFRKVCAAVQYAHDRLVVHRDLKPSNILVTPAGEPKLLDFGIAKIVKTPGSMSLDSTITMLQMMTPEYASPEQVRGERITAATDVYSLGVLLYRLLTGHSPYRPTTRSPHVMARLICESEPEKPSSIIGKITEVSTKGGRERRTLTPESVSATRDGSPSALRQQLAGDLDAIVLKAIQKDPADRYRSVMTLSEDIGRHLNGQPVHARRAQPMRQLRKYLRAHRGRMVYAAAGLFCAAALTAALIPWWKSRSEAPVRESANSVTVPFTTFPGNETQALFSPDGKHVVYVWGGEKNTNSDIYVQPVGAGRLIRLTTDQAHDVSPAWSPDGTRIAFFRTSSKETAVFVSPSFGGVHTKVADAYPSRIEAVGRYLDWSPDGRHLALADKQNADDPFHMALLSVDDGRKTPLTAPSPRTIGDTSPAFSPDGKYLSFIRAASSGISDLWVLPLAGGEPRQLTFDNRVVLAQTWMADSGSLVFSSNRVGGHALWRVSVDGGTPVRLSGIGSNIADPALSRDGRHLLYSQFFIDTNIWGLDLDAPGRAGESSEVIFSTQYDSSPQFSPDGQRVAFRSSRSGSNEIWIADREGKNALQLTDYRRTLTGTPRWSPDGKHLAFDSRPHGQPDIFVIDSQGGAPRRLTTESAEDVVPSWSRDGRWVYFASHRAGSWQVWKIPSEGGTAVQVTKQGGFAAFESPDGKYLYYAKSRSGPGLWRVPAAGGKEELVLKELKEGYWGYWAIGKEGVYFVDPLDKAHQRAAIFYFHLKSRRIQKIADLGKPPIVADSAFALSPDEKRVLYTRIDQSGSDIFMASRPDGRW